MYIIVSATQTGPLSACMHITCVKAARDMTRETESHHGAATQGGWRVEVGLVRGVWSLASAAAISSLSGDSGLTPRRSTQSAPFNVHVQIQNVSFLIVFNRFLPSKGARDRELSVPDQVRNTL